MPYLLSGSYAYDTILSHDGPFHSRILPEAISRLNVAFGVDRVRKNFGGTAGNIAYNAALLQDYPLLIGSLGHDGGPYLEHLANQGHQTQSLTVHGSEDTPHAWILTDQLNNQITAFNTGAMRNMPEVPADTPQIWHLAPDHHDTTLSLARRAIAQRKRYFFDPGQALPGFLERDHARANRELADILFSAQGIFLNDYEATLLERHFDAPLSDWLRSDDQFVIRTLGGDGALLLTTGGSVKIPVAPCDAVVDPTGCGDAFRAGFLYGYRRDWSLPECARMGAALGSFAIECHGGQGHAPSLQDVLARARPSRQE